ncbi:MAG: NUDIX hydrolase [bacterium]
MNFTLPNWKLIEEKEISPSKWFPLFCSKLENTNGTVISDYFHARFPEVVLLCAVTKDNELIMVEQYKQGIGKVTLELPGGFIDPDETPIAAAERELMEECGIKVETEKLHLLGKIATCPSKIKMELFIFYYPEAAISKPQKLDSNEIIKIHQIPIKEISKLSGKEINCSETLAGISFLEKYLKI